MNNTSDEFDESAVIRQIVNGNVNAFELILNHYQGFVTNIVLKHVPQDRVHEVAHETFVQAYKSLKTFKAKKPFSHWLSTIAVRSCYNFWREHYKHREEPLSSMSEDCQRWMDTALSKESYELFEEQAQKQEALGLLYWALDRLSPEDRTVLTLNYLEEYTIMETAELLGWSVPNVKVRSFRARKKLRAILSKVMSEGEVQDHEIKKGTH